MDDIITGADTEEEAFDLYTQSKDIFCRGGFNLRKFISNSWELQQQINYNEGTRQCSQSETEDSYADATLGVTPTLNAGKRKILGVAWSPTSDRLIFEFTELARLANSLQPTKRNVVSVIGRFYDPLSTGDD